MGILGTIIGLGVVGAFLWKGAVMQNLLDEWVVKDDDQDS